MEYQKYVINHNGQKEIHNGHKVLRFIMIAFVFLVKAFGPFMLIFIMPLNVKLLSNLI